MKLTTPHSAIKSFLLGTILIFTSAATIAQTVTVDAEHVANTFSPVRSLGAAIDRLRTGTPEHLLTDPLLKEILGAGWQTVTYRQNTELMVEAWHWNPEWQVEQSPRSRKATSSAMPSRLAK